MRGQGGASQASLMVLVCVRGHQLGDHDLDASVPVDQIDRLKNIAAELSN